MKQAHFDGRILVLGFGGVARCTLPLLLKHLDVGANDDRFPIHPVRLVKIMREEMADDGIVCLDNGMYKIWFARYYRCRQPNTMLLDNALATMGAGLPSAMAAKMVHPDRKVVAVSGPVQ